MVLEWLDNISSPILVSDMLKHSFCLQTFSQYLAQCTAKKQIIKNCLWNSNDWWKQKRRQDRVWRFRKRKEWEPVRLGQWGWTGDREPPTISTPAWAGLAAELSLSSTFLLSALRGGVRCLYIKLIFRNWKPHSERQCSLGGFWQDWKVITLERNTINQKFPPRWATNCLSPSEESIFQNFAHQVGGLQVVSSIYKWGTFQWAVCSLPERWAEA